MRERSVTSELKARVMPLNKKANISKLLLILLGSVLFLIIMAQWALAGVYDDAVYYYRFDTDTASLIIDSQGNENLTAVNSPPYSSLSHWGDGSSDHSANDGTATTDEKAYRAPKFNQGEDWAFSMWLRPVDVTGGAQQQVLWRNAGGIGCATYRGHAYFDAAGDFQIIFDCTASPDDQMTVSSSYFPNDAWVNIIIMGDDSADTQYVYVNGTLIDSDGLDESLLSSIQPSFLAEGANANRHGFDGYADHFAFWNRTLSSAEMEEIVNGTTPSVNFTITAQDAFDASSISSFSAQVDGVNYSTTTGTLTTGLPINNSATYDIFVFNASGYFNRTYADHNFSAALTAELKGSHITFDAYELITNNSLSSVSFYVDGQNLTDFYLKAGDYNVTAVKTGYYNFTEQFTVTAHDNKTIDLIGMYNGLANITLKEIVSGDIISTWSAVSNLSTSDSTTSGSILMPVMQNTSVHVNITASGYVSIDNYTFSVSTALEHFNVSTYQFNSIRVNIFNETDLTALTSNVTIHVIGNISSYTTYTATGFKYLTLLTPQEYELRFEAEGFNPISKFLSVINDSTQNVSVYMVENQTTSLQVIEVVDTSGQDVEGAYVWLQKQIINGTPMWITIQEAEINSQGQTSVWVERDTTVYYRFAVIYDGQARPIQPSGNTYTTATNFLPGVTETIQLIVDIEDDPVDYITDALGLSWNVTTTNTTVTFTWLDARNVISGTRLEISGRYLNQSLEFESIINLTSSSTSGTLSYTFLIVNNTEYKYRAYALYATSETLLHEGHKYFGPEILIDKNEGMLLAVLILIVVALVSVKFGPLVSSSLTVISLVPLTYLGFVSIPATIITSLLALCIILFFRVRKQ